MSYLFYCLPRDCHDLRTLRLRLNIKFFIEGKETEGKIKSFPRDIQIIFMKILNNNTDTRKSLFYLCLRYNTRILKIKFLLVTFKYNHISESRNTFYTLYPHPSPLSGSFTLDIEENLSKSTLSFTFVHKSLKIQSLTVLLPKSFYQQKTLRKVFRE